MTPPAYTNIDYSLTTLGISGGVINETTLSDSPLLGLPDPPKYRMAWYTPITVGSLADILDVPAADAALRRQPDSGRRTGDRTVTEQTKSRPSSSTGRGNGAPVAPQDVNFDGVLTAAAPPALPRPVRRGLSAARTRSAAA